MEEMEVPVGHLILYARTFISEIELELEDGSVVSPVEGWLDHAHSLTSNIPDERAGYSQSLTDFAQVKQPQVTVRGVVTGNHDPKDFRKAWQKIYDVHRKATPVTVITEWFSYSNMLIAKADAKPAGQPSRGMMLTLTFKRFVRAPKPPPPRRASRATGGPDSGTIGERHDTTLWLDYKRRTILEQQDLAARGQAFAQFGVPGSDDFGVTYDSIQDYNSFIENTSTSQDSATVLDAAGQRREQMGGLRAPVDADAAIIKIQNHALTTGVYGAAQTTVEDVAAGTTPTKTTTWTAGDTNENYGNNWFTTNK